MMDAQSQLSKATRFKPWELVVLTYGDSSRHLPWSCSQSGSSTTHAHTRANWAAGLDAKRKLQEIAAKAHGGRPVSGTLKERPEGRSFQIGTAGFEPATP